MYVDRPVRDAVLLEDERFAHFLPLLFGKLAFRAAGKAAKWLGKKALGGAKAAGRGAVSLMRAAAQQEEAPSVSEQEIEEIPEYEAAEEFDIYGGDGGILVRGDHIGAMDEEEFDEFASRLADFVEQDMATVRDEGQDEYDVVVDEQAPSFAHFKKLKKKLKKLTKLATKLGPLASFIPGGQVIGMATQFAGAAKGKKGRRRMAAQLVPEEYRSMVPEQLQSLASDYDFESYDGETGVSSEEEAQQESARIHGIASQMESDRRHVR